MRSDFLLNSNQCANDRVIIHILSTAFSESHRRSSVHLVAGLLCMVIDGTTVNIWCVYETVYSRNFGALSARSLSHAPDLSMGSEPIF